MVAGAFQIFEVIIMRVAVLRIEGTNCEEESLYAFKNVGFDAEYVHLNQLIRGKSKLDDYDIIMIPGGSSAGDYIRAGAIFAARIKSTIMNDVKKFVEDEKLILGVCNGFQVLMELGLLPGTDGISDKPEAVLTTNDSNRFECRPTYVKVENSNTPFTGMLKKDGVLLIPSAHAEGKIEFPDGKEDEMLDRLISQNQIVFRYVDPQGNYAGYPWNPNGSVYNIAALTNNSHTVMGTMPHPERVFFSYQSHDRFRRTSKHGDGYGIFLSMAEYVKKRYV